LAGHGPGEDSKRPAGTVRRPGLGKRGFPAGAAPRVIGASTARVVIVGRFVGPEETEDGTQLGRFRDDATASQGQVAVRGGASAFGSWRASSKPAGVRGDDLEHGIQFLIPGPSRARCARWVSLARTSKLSTWSRLQT